ncbi:hypothetical protein D9619_005166 [Psilocybe cf. subviscida]|uniref:Uncharacterized protein n=1 Tax=Psilocybe cf. subviscida TaxID=2480587 RepID=A0A8H5FB33_9AGAR|nr:hypothetical protein D9619_005166 [Psilocybe cf. subviscida]
MSIIGTGFIRSSTSGARFLGSFIANNQSYLVAGSFSSSVPPFKSSAAQLRFDDAESLSGTKQLDGVVGSDKIKLTIGDGATITGKLDVPIHPASSVVGAAFLTQA